LAFYSSSISRKKFTIGGKWTQIGDYIGVYYFPLLGLIVGDNYNGLSMFPNGKGEFPYPKFANGKGGRSCCPITKWKKLTGRKKWLPKIKEVFWFYLKFWGFG